MNILKISRFAIFYSLLFVLLVFLLLLFSSGNVVRAQSEPGLSLSGHVYDSQGQPIQNAEVALFLDEAQENNLISKTNQDGVFLLDYPTQDVIMMKLIISHPHFEDVVWVADQEDIEILLTEGALRIEDFTLEREISAGFWIAAAVFGGVLVLIITERMHSTLAALLGAGTLLFISLAGRVFGEQLFIYDFDRAITYIDFNVIFLVLGMMIIVGTIERTGIFQWIAYHSYRISGGRLWLLVVILMLFTSVASALLDNVTTMLLVAPISIQIALALGINPLSLLIPEMLASNVGGIATLIGTPNNILIGSYAGLGFNDFLRDLTPGVLLVQLVLTGYVLLVFQPKLRKASETQSEELLNLLEENAKITEPDVLKRAGIVFLGVLVFFILGEQFHLVPAVTAIIGAPITLVVVRADVDEIMRVVDWSTLLFFMALFMIIGAIQEVGLISMIATGINNLVGGNMTAATLVVAWGTGLLCLLVPTIPLTAALLPVVGYLSQTIPGGGNALYYSLSMGSALGANNSLIGATNNMVTAGIAKRAGFPISYKEFIKIGLPAAMITLIVGSIYLLIRF